jgi:putative cell wall-binding protein
MGQMEDCGSAGGGPTLAIMVGPRFRFGARARFLTALGLFALICTGVEPPVVRANLAQPAGALGSATVSTESLGGEDQYAVAVAISGRLFPNGGAPVVYLAAGENYADALAAGPIAAREGGAILYTSASTLTAAVGQELIRLAPARVEILGVTSVIDDNVLDQVTAILAPTTVVERLAGSDACGTAAALSARSFEPGAASTVFVASAQSPSDAIAAGPAAARLGSPLLLVTAASLPATTAAELLRLEPDRVFVVGSPIAVSDEVLNAIKLIVPQTERVYGADAYATAAAVAARFLPLAATDVAAEVVAGATGYADGLPAVPLAAARQAPILFAQPDDLLPTPTRDAMIAGRPTRIVIAGSVSEVVRAQLVGFSDGRLTVPAPTPAYPTYDSAYHDYGEMVTLIKATEIAYPTLVHVFSIGKSFEGRDIWAAKISSNVSVDSGKPEVLFDALHHADEHLGVEQALYMLATLTANYSTDVYVHRLVNERVVWIVFALNPDGWAYDLSGGSYHFWRKNRQETGGYYGTDINRNYGYRWGCCGGSSSNPSAYNFRGPSVWSTPEARALRDFVASRVVNGVQLIKAHVTLHTNGELILYPYCYTKSALPTDMNFDDYSTFVKLAQTMAHMNGYKAEQSSHMYVTDGDEIDWLYHQYRIFSFTFELYPKELGSLTADDYPPYSVVATQTARNRGALLYLIDMAACPYQVIGKAAQYCSGAPVVTPSSGLMP